MDALSYKQSKFLIFPRRTGDTSTESPVWSLGTELSEEKYIPGKDELKDFNKTMIRYSNLFFGER